MLSKNILGFIFISPNFGINHKLANLITWPLSKYWLSLIIGKTTKSKARNDLNAKYWTLAYPTNALIPMAKLVKKVNEQDFSNVKIPALFYFSLDDKVVRPDKTIQFIKNWGGESTSHNVTMSDNDDQYSHVVVGNIISPNQTAHAYKIMIKWINSIKK